MEALNPREVTVLWHGWLKKLGGFSKRWKRRYFIFLSTVSGMKELRHYDTQKDVASLLSSTPKGVIALTDATGICCFLPPSPSAVAAKKHTMFNLMDSHDASAADIQDQKFAILTPIHVHMLAFQSGREWANASESQQGLALLASLSAFYSTVEVLHTGTMSKKRERTGHSAAKHTGNIISYWKRHFFVFLSSGDLLYFRDETLAEFQGRVDVRHAPTVRVTGERMLEEKKKELGAILLKLTKKTGAGIERENCLVWIATPPSKMFVLKMQEDNEGGLVETRRPELTASAKKWLSLLLQGHAEAKYTQLEQCITMEKFEATPEVISAVRAGIPDELRGAMWKGLSGATDLQRRAELKRTIRKVTKTFSIRSLSTTKDDAPVSSTAQSFFDEMSRPLDPNNLDEPEGKMILSRLSAIAIYEMKIGPPTRVSTSRGHRLTMRGDPGDSGSRRSPFPAAPMSLDEFEDDQSDSESSSPTSKDHSGKENRTGRAGQHVYPSEAMAPTWEISARRRLLIATSRFNPFSHPFPWKALCLLLAYLDEDSAFWVINSIQDVYFPGYYHGYRPALQVDIAAFCGMLEERAPTLFAHLRELAFPIDQTVERWFLSLFTSTYLPLPTVLRVWDAFFAQGVRILFGVGLALFLRAEDKLFRAKSASEAREILIVTERTSIDADALFSHALKDDLNISWLTEERFDKIRARYRQRVIDLVTTELHFFKEKLSILSQLQDQIGRILSTAKRLASSTKRSQGDELIKSSSLLVSPFQSIDAWDPVAGEDPEGDDGVSSLSASLTALQACLRSAEDAILEAASALNSRQARWLALSSQLIGCPLSRSTIRLSSDLQSWSLQVKEGKVSGSGLDAFPDPDFKLVSRLEEQHGMFFDMGDGEGSSCLVSHRNDFEPDNHYITDGFLHALATAMKAASAVRLECIGSANRSDWHGGRWLQSTISYPNDTHGGLNGRARASSRGIQRSALSTGNSAFAASMSNSRRNPRSLADELDHLTSRNSLDDAVLRRKHGAETMQRPSMTAPPMTAPPMTPVREHVVHDGNGASQGAILGGASIYMDYESTYYATMPSSFNFLSSSPNTIAESSPLAFGPNQVEDFGVSVENRRAYQHASSQYRQSEQVLHTAVDAMMSCFSRFLRLESRHPSKSKRELHHRAMSLEDELLQELKDVDAIAVTSKELY